MLSRVAENVYWMARYVERAENTARLVLVNANLVMDLPRGIAPGWERMIDITGSAAQFRELHKDFGERQVLRFLIGELQSPSSILAALAAARENCRTIRDIVPREAWEQINELFLYARDNLPSGLTKNGRYGYLRRVVLGSQTITGLLAGTMNHDQGYAFLRSGRNLERADMTTRIVDVRSADLLEHEPQNLRPFDTIQWVSVLKSLTGYQMYRRSIQARVQRGHVLRFLFQSRMFPRAVLHAVEAVADSVATLPHHEAPLRVIGRLQRQLLGTDVAALSQEALHGFVDELQRGITEIHDEISRAYFLPPVETAVRTGRTTPRQAAETGALPAPPA